MMASVLLEGSNYVWYARLHRNRNRETSVISILFRRLADTFSYLIKLVPKGSSTSVCSYPGSGCRRAWTRVLILFFSRFRAGAVVGAEGVFHVQRKSGSRSHTLTR